MTEFENELYLFAGTQNGTLYLAAFNQDGCESELFLLASSSPSEFRGILFFFFLE